MQTATPTKTRTLRLTETAGGPALVIREQTSDGPVKVEAYYLSRSGRGFRLTKADTVTYGVSLDGERSTCSCKGFRRWGWHVKDGELVACKHVMALLSLQAAGRLPE